MKDKSRRELISRYLKGTCTQDEKREVENWYLEAESDADIMEFLSDEEKEILRTIIFRGIREKITLQPEIRAPRLRWHRYAAGIAALLVVCLGLIWVTKLSGLRDNTGAGNLSEQVIVVLNKQKTILRSQLPDGSTAWLHPGSSLEHSAQFGNSERNVIMTGEVFFEVQRDTLRPFIVKAGGILTKVLGTSFRVKTSEREAKVSVVTGKVTVERIKATSEMSPNGSQSDSKTTTEVSEITLVPDESATYSADTKLLIRENKIKDPDMTIWQKENMSFHNTPVSEVLEKIDSLYGVKVEVADENINEYLLRADFSGMNLPDVLEILGHSLDLSYDINGRQITLRKSVQ